MGTLARTLPDWTLTVKQYAKFLPVLYPVVRDIIIVLTFSCVNHLQLLSNVLSVTTYIMSQTMILLTILQPLGTNQRVQSNALRLTYTTTQWPIVAYKSSEMWVVTLESLFSDLDRIRVND
jgi:hypothetical protein